MILPPISGGGGPRAAWWRGFLGAKKAPPPPSAVPLPCKRRGGLGSVRLPFPRALAVGFAARLLLSGDRGAGAAVGAFVLLERGVAAIVLALAAAAVRSHRANLLRPPQRSGGPGLSGLSSASAPLSSPDRTVRRTIAAPRRTARANAPRPAYRGTSGAG